MRPTKNLAAFGSRGPKNHLLVATPKKMRPVKNFVGNLFLDLHCNTVFILPEGTLAFIKEKELRLIQLLSLVNAAANDYFVLVQKQ